MYLNPEFDIYYIQIIKYNIYYNQSDYYVNDRP